MQPIKIGDQEYDQIPSSAIVASKWLSDVWAKLGRPDSPLSESGEKLMKVVIAVWEDLNPKDSKQWYADRAEYKNNELSISEQVSKRTGRSLASYPYPVYQMMKRLFPKFDFGSRVNTMSLVTKYPLFRMANKV